MLTHSSCIQFVALCCLTASLSLAETPYYPDIEVTTKVARVKCDMIAMTILEDGPAISQNTWGGSYYKKAYEFRTPGNGTSYTLKTLANIAGDSLLTTATGYVVRDRIVISPRDSLDISGERIYIANQSSSGTLTRSPFIIVEGQLWARNSAFIGLYTSSDYPSCGGGIFVSGASSLQASAIIQSCSFQNLVHSVDAFGTSTAAQITDCQIEDCPYGVSSQMGADVIIRKTSFLRSPLIAYEGRLDIADSHLQTGAAFFYSPASGSQIVGCTLDGTRIDGQGYGSGAGVYSDGASPFTMADTVVTSHSIGLLCSGSQYFLIKNCRFQNNRYSGLTFWWGSKAIVRDCQMANNGGSYYTGQTTLKFPAVSVLFDAVPNLGTKSSPGNNVFSNNNPIAFYNATTSTIYAQGNIWGDDVLPHQVENLIYHEFDDHNDADESGFQSGRVVFSPFSAGLTATNHAVWPSY